MKVAYIIGPYRNTSLRGVIENIRRAEAVALELWKRGYAVICPHMNTALFDGECANEVWLNGGREILKRCDTVVRLRGWQASEGSIEESQLAESLGIEILDWPESFSSVQVEAFA